jgi:ribose/xylose/arabinose/galactoside ABC-type transport system permease subunit/ABC-type glutathione transport system ATPase component
MIRSPAEGSHRPGLATVGLLLLVGLSLAYDNFLSSANLTAIALASASVLIAALGLMALLVSGNVDLSIGSQYALVSVVTAIVARDSGSALLAVVVALALGAGLGFVNGVLVDLLRVSPLIVTLATLGIYGGAAFAIAGGGAIGGLPASFTSVGDSELLGVPLPVVIALVVYCAGGWMLTTTATGLRLFAIGSSRRTTSLVGVPVRRLVIATFAANGALIGLVALLSTAQLQSGSPLLGARFELNVLAVVILGGVAFTGGRGHPVGVFTSVATVGVLNSGLIFAGLSDFYQQISQGTLLLVALAADELLLVRRERRVRQGLAAPPPATRQTPDAQRRERPRTEQTGPVLDVSGLTVRFAGVLALDDVSLTVGAGEVICLVGDNGAGKSTLAKTISGAVRPADGTVTVNGRELPGNPAATRDAGIEIVFQELALCPHLNVPDNLVLGREPRRRVAGVLPVRDVREAEALARARLEELGVGLTDLRKPVRLLSGGERQIVQILRVMRERLSVVILDEPTAALGLNQAAEVRALARAIAAAGTSVLLITHDVEEVFEVADRVVVLQRGKLVFDGPLASVSRVELLQMMSGRRRVEAARIVDAVSSERRRIERDLQDSVEQRLVNASLMVDLAADRLRAGADGEVTEILADSVDALRAALARVRDLGGHTPALPIADGLVSSIEALLADSPVPIRLRSNDVPRLPEPVELAAHAAAAEALANARSHANAEEIAVEIEYVDGRLTVTVADDGEGMQDSTGGPGLAAVRDRVGAVGGVLHIRTAVGDGTRVTASMPATELTR